MRITLLQGHPDPRGGHFGHALAAAYAEAAADAQHELKAIEVARMHFPLLRSAEEWKDAPLAPIRAAQQAIAWAERLVIFFPLWLAKMGTFGRAGT